MTNGSIEMGIEKINTEKDKFDPEQFCRMCGLRFSQDMNSFGLFIENSAGNGVVNGNIMDLLTILKFNISKNDGLPQQICQSCFDTFAVIDEFYNKCLRAQKILLSFKNKTAEGEDVESVGNQLQPDALENGDMQMQDETYLENIFDNAKDLIDELENTSSEYDSTYDAESVADYLFNADIDEDDADFEYFLNPEMTGNNQNMTDNIAQKSEEIAKNEKELSEDNIIQEKMEDTKLYSERDKGIGKCSSVGAPSSAVSAKPIENNFDQVGNLRKNESQCKICSRIYRSGTLLNAHIRNSHSENKYWSCSICRKKCFTDIQYNFHMKGHEPSFRSFRCKFCEKSFIKDYHRIKHERTHINEKSNSNKPGNKILNDLKVSETDENKISSVNNSNINRALHLRKNEKLNFTTRDCPQTAESLVRHDKMCRRESESVNVPKHHTQHIQDGKTFSCLICMKSFTRKNSLTRHLKSHPRTDESSTGKMKRLRRAKVVP